MSAVIEDEGGTMALSPEQRAVLAGWGGESQLDRAVQHLEIEVDAGHSAERIRAAVERALRPHDILRTAIRPVSGRHGLQMQQQAQRDLRIDWVRLEGEGEGEGEGALAGFRTLPLDPARGELVRAAIMDGEDGRRTLALAVSVLVADRGSLAGLAAGIARACANDSVEDEPFQYAQYAAWRCALEVDGTAAEAHAYWRGYLQDAGQWAPPRLVHRREGARERPLRRRSLAQPLDAPALADAVEAAAAANVTLELLLQAVWCALLARLSGFNAFAIGWQHDCRRDYPVMQGAVGVFDKILPLSIEGGGEMPFSAWLARRAACAEAHVEAQEQCPLETAPGAAFLDVGFACHDLPLADGVPLGHAAALPGPMPCFELALVADLSAHEGRLSLHADAAAYSQRACERLLDQYLVLLRGVLDRPHSALSTLPLVGAPEWDLLRQDWRGADLDVGPLSIAQQVARWARETPDAPAIAAGECTWSYAALDARANRLAHWLRAQGVGAGELVGLALPRSPELIVAMLAAWRVGAGYLPLEPDWPAARQHAVLDEARPALVLGAAPGPGDGPWRVCMLDEVVLDGFDGAAPPVHSPQPGDPAYTLFTSGSTGRPKGVRIEQQQLLNYVVAASAAMELAGRRRWGLVSSVAADLGNTALFAALFHGACLAIARADEAKDAAAFARFMKAQQIDALKIVPSHLDALIEGEAPRLPRTLVLGGEPASRALIERIAAMAPGCAVYNHFGPTEATVGVMVHRVALDQVQPEVQPLTRVLANNRVYVLDAEMQPVPAGGIGELFIGGAQVCRGYLNREAADGAFVADPWQPAQTLYRTGDLAWVLPEGGLRLAGRKDHQVKIRGFRVEPGEVEAVLLRAPGVRQAVVTARDGGSGLQLTAHIAGARDMADPTAWRQHAQTHLPEPMRPVFYVVREDFPRLPNGKIDRLALEAMQAGEEPQQATSAGAEPRNALEAALARSMAELLKRDRIAADADFFALGGHSLLAIRLVARLRKQLQLEVEPGLVFDHPTAQALAAAIHALGDPQRIDQLARTHVAAEPAVKEAE